MKNQMKKVSIVLFAFCFFISCKKDDAAFLEEIRKELLEERQRQLASGRVPGDAVDNSWDERGPTNVGGRTRSIMFDPNLVFLSASKF
jgi:hypothetical protein